MTERGLAHISPPSVARFTSRDCTTIAPQTRAASTGSCFSSSCLAIAALQLILATAPTGVASTLEYARASQRLSQLPYYDLDLAAPRTAEVKLRSQVRSLQRRLSLSISDLATILGVSRQAVYKWFAGGPISNLNRGKLDDLFLASEVLSPWTNAGTQTLSTRKDREGLTLIESVKQGRSVRTWAEEVGALLAVEREQRDVVAALIAPSQKGPPRLRELGKPALDERDA